MKPAYTFVPSEGPLDAHIICLCESPWLNECESGRPLAGASGNLLKRWWAQVEGEQDCYISVGRDLIHKKTEDKARLFRSNMRLMNLFPYRPPTREIDSVPADKLIKAIEGIHERVARLRDPYVIVTMGNYATYALTGKGKVKAQVRNAFGMQTNVTEAEKKAGITSLRGSIYPYQDLNGRTIKVIPTIHPAAVLQMGKWEKRSIKDWEKIHKQAQFRENFQPRREHIIDPTATQQAAFCQEVADTPNARMAVDIETWGNQLSCVGFALSPWKSITIPVSGKWKDNLAFVKWLCECDAEKVLCNGLYDWYWLDAERIQLRNYRWDVQSMHHALDPAESHSLDFLASIYCPHYVYWKDEAKEAEEIIKYAKDLDALWVYNGLDCCYTRELVDILEAELQREGMLEFYFQHYASMFEPLLRTMRHGMRVDVEKQKEGAKRLRGELKGLHAQLNELAGCELFATEERTAWREPTEEEWDKLFIGNHWEDWVRPQYGTTTGVTNQLIEPPPAKYINREARNALKDAGFIYMMSGKNAGKIRYKVQKIKKDFSKDKLAEFFHGTLGLPKQYKLRKGKNGKKKTESLDEDSLRKLMYKYTKAVEPGKLLLQYRGKKKELDYLKGAYDKDGRVRCEYTMRTNAGRLSSRKNPMRSGLNLQNLKR